MSNYIIDTCSFTWAMRDTYPMDVHPAFWRKFEDSAKIGKIVSSHMVYLEIEKQDDDLFKWCKLNSHIFLPVDQKIIYEVATIAKKFPRLINIEREKDFADPFLIAQAKVFGGTLVTQEKKNGPFHPRQKIPDVAELMNIRTTNILGMVKELGWVFH
jgi:hypothetical protein